MPRSPSPVPPRNLCPYIHHLCLQGLVSIEECWSLYREKHSARDVREAADKIRYAVERVEMQRPLQAIAGETQRAEAATVRAWYRDQFCKPPVN